MGLTIKRVGFAALALAAVLLPLRKPAQTDAQSSSVGRGARLDSLGWARHEAHLAWSAFALHDTATARVAKLPAAGPRPTIAWSGFTGPVRNTDADSIVTSLWLAIGTTNPAVRTSVLIYNHAQYTAPAYNGALIESRDGKTDCVAIAPGRVFTTGGTEVWENELADALAPCALLAAFGPPGSGIAQWLTGTRYASAHSNDWLPTTGRRRAFQPYGDTTRYGTAPWVAWGNTRDRYNWPDNQLLSFVNIVGLLEYAVLARPNYEFGASGLRCIVGVEQDCVNGVLHSAVTFPAADAMPTDLTQHVSRRNNDTTTVGTVRPASGGLLSAMITEFGRDRFQKFWSSDQPFEAAFQAEFGISLGAWTAKWAAREWAGSYEAKHGNPEILLGVTLKPSWIPLLFGWSILAVAIAAGVAKRRTA